MAMDCKCARNFNVRSSTLNIQRLTIESRSVCPVGRSALDAGRLRYLGKPHVLPRVHLEIEHQ
jgi:hypothetical protein